jgi:hypothetical protein
MADDRIQRPIRASQPPMRSAPPSAAPVGASGNDPLAELARLIGQNDPFAEYGRENARRTAQQQPAPAPATHHDDYNAAPEAYPPQHYQQAESFAPRAQVPGYPPDDAAGYEHEAEYQTNAQIGGQAGSEDHDFYDDVPPHRRLGILAIAAVFALAVIGTAGAFGYRALFGSSAASGPPPVIKAETAPTKVVPAANSKDPKSGKLIYDRVVERGQDEKLVSREERPVVMNTPPGAAPQDQPAGALQPPTGSGVVATEPKKVHTIAIRPDGTTMAEAAPTPVVASPSPPPMPRAVASPPTPRAPAAEPALRQPVARAEPPPPPPHRVAAPAPSNAPLSLSPDAPSQAAPAPRVTRTAVAAPPTQIATPAPRAAPASAPASGGSGYAVQVSSQRSEGEAQAAFRSLQTKFPSQLGGKQPMIRHVDLGAKGTYYRAMVGPLGSDEASQLCSSLKAAGGQCIVQRI